MHLSIVFAQNPRYEKDGQIAQLNKCSGVYAINFRLIDVFGGLQRGSSYSVIEKGYRRAGIILAIENSYLCEKPQVRFPSLVQRTVVQ